MSTDYKPFDTTNIRNFFAITNNTHWHCLYITRKFPPNFPKNQHCERSFFLVVWGGISIFFVAQQSDL